jgi:hypothetical protein
LFLKCDLCNLSILFVAVEALGSHDLLHPIEEQKFRYPASVDSGRTTTQGTQERKKCKHMSDSILQSTLEKEAPAKPHGGMLSECKSRNTRLRT